MKLNVETRTMIMDQPDDNKNVGDKNNALSSYGMVDSRLYVDSLGCLIIFIPLLAHYSPSSSSQD